MSTLDYLPRKRKIQTYGKAARKHVFSPADDSPEKPKTASVIVPPKKPLSRAAFEDVTRERSQDRSEANALFEVPSSDDESEPRAKTPGKLMRPSVLQTNNRASPKPVRPSTTKGQSAPITTLPSRGRPQALKAQSRPARVASASASEGESLVVSSPTTKKRKRDGSPFVVVDVRELNTALVERGNERAITPASDGGSQTDNTDAMGAAAELQLLQEYEDSVLPTKPVFAKRATQSKVHSSAKRVAPRTRLAPTPTAAVTQGDSEMRDVTPRKAPMPSARSTPEVHRSLAQHLPSTPPSLEGADVSTLKSMESVTPRQRNLWNKLLDDSIIQPTPSKLKLESMRLSSPPAEPVSLGGKRPPHVHPGKPRGRLAQNLLRSRQTSQDSDGESDDSEESKIDTTVDRMKSLGAQEYADGAADAVTNGIAERSADLPDSQGSQPKPQPAVSTLAGAKVTYSKQRSYLNETSLDDVLALDAPTPERSQSSSFSMKPSTTSFAKTASTLSSTFDFDEDEDLAGGGMKNIHELRAKGGNRRLHDELDGLLLDIEDSGASLTSKRRSAMIELALKLRDKPTIGWFLDHGFEQRLLKTLTGAVDEIFNFASSSVVFLILQADVSVATLETMVSTHVQAMLGYLLSQKKSVNRIAKDRQSNMSRMGRESLQELVSSIQQSDVWGPSKLAALSPQLLALQTLEIFVRSLREKGNGEDVLDDRTLQKLVTIAFKQTRDLPAADSCTDHRSLELALSILESNSISSVRDHTVRWVESTAHELAAVVEAVLGASHDTLRHCEFLALRLTLNMTNDNPTMCEQVSTTAFVAKLLGTIADRQEASLGSLPEDERTPVLDRLILCLGTATNLAEHSDGARRAAFSESDIVDRLLRSFIKGHHTASKATSIEQSQANVAFGYLAVLLGNLCQNGKVRAEVCNRLPNSRLDSLTTAIQEFIWYNERVDRDLYEGGEGQDIWSSYTARLQAVVDRLKRLEA